MKRALKFLHIVAAMGMGGAIAAYLVVLATAPEVTVIEQYAPVRDTLARVSRWILLPSAALVLISGLLSIAVHRPFHNAMWVWAKALSGVVVFEGTLGGIDAPAQRAAQVMAEATAAGVDSAVLADLMRHEWGALWIILALSLANTALGVWRPRFGVGA